MAALKLDMTIPLGDAGHVRLVVDVGDLAALDAGQRQGLAETCEDFTDFAAQTLAPAWVKLKAAAEAPDPDELRAQLQKPPATVHDPSASVLDGIRGTRTRDKL